VADVYTLIREGFKDILQELMEAELDAALGYEKNQKGDMETANKRNGHSPKKLKSQYGEFQTGVPRDRNGEFEPKIVPKYQRDVSGIEEKVISLYGRGMSTRDIHDQIQDLYGMEMSAEMVSKITDRILPEIREWQSRLLNPVYPFVFMDCIHYKVREDGRILSRAAYVVLGVTTEGYKEIQMTRLEDEIQRYKKLELGLYEDFVEGIINKAEYTDFRENYRGLIEEKQEALKRLKREQQDAAATGSQNRAWVQVFAQYENVRTGKVQCIVVRDFSRFGRDYVETGNFKNRNLPYGYLWNEDKTAYVVDEEAAAVVRQIFEWKLREVLVYTIVERLKAGGIENPERHKRRAAPGTAITSRARAGVSLPSGVSCKTGRISGR